MTTLPEASAREYREQGFALTHEPMLASPAIDAALAGIEAVLAGHYETGVAPVQRNWKPGDDAVKLRKIDQPHLSNREIWRVATDSRIGERVGLIMDAQFIQLWAVQLLYKPPGGSAKANVGWHQDINYWNDSWSGEVMTAWVALTDVPLERGPMIFVPGSHRWGELPNLDFWNTQSEKSAIAIPPGALWTEVPAVLRAGEFSLHNAFTVHGSGPNISESPRISLALHLRTEKSTPNLQATRFPAYTASYMPYLDRDDRCPVIWRRSR